MTMPSESRVLGIDLPPTAQAFLRRFLIALAAETKWVGAQITVERIVNSTQDLSGVTIDHRGVRE